jgi:hypothetical protein
MKSFIKIFTISIALAILLGSCSGGPRKKMEFVVVSVMLDYDPASRENPNAPLQTNPGYRHNLREIGTNQPAFVHYPEVRFAAGDRVIMKRNRRGVTFELAVQPLY